jgi:hypothetical protein
MLSHCMFCDAELESPGPEFGHVRMRIAFDPWLGRLWQVCGACARWNAVPLDDRWDALERYDRAARDRSRLLLSTDHLSLLSVGRAQLIRVGEAPRVDFCDWRYSSRLQAYPLRRGGLWAWLMRLLSSVPESEIGDVDPYTRVHRLPAAWMGAPFIEHGPLLTAVFGAVPLVDACRSCGYPMMIEPARFGDVRLSLEGGSTAVVGICALCGETGAAPLRAARPALRVGLAVVNRRRTEPGLVRSAADLIERRASADEFLDAVARHGRTLASLPAEVLVAIGMGLDEQTEAEALEAEWRVAEELIAIMDDELTDVPGFDAFRARFVGGPQE